MLNQCILVGRVVQIKEENKTTILTLRIARNYKDSDTGDFEADNHDVQPLVIRKQDKSIERIA